MAVCYLVFALCLLLVVRCMFVCLCAGLSLVAVGFGVGGCCLACLVVDFGCVGLVRLFWLREFGWGFGCHFECVILMMILIARV